MISSKFFLHFLKFWFWGFLGGKRAKNDLKLPISVCYALYLRNCWSYHQDFDNNICRCFSFLKKKNATLYILTLLKLLAHFSGFLNGYLFFKFISKWQKEILRCVPPSSRVYDFLNFKRLFFVFHFIFVYCMSIPFQYVYSYIFLMAWMIHPYVLGENCSFFKNWSQCLKSAP